MSWLLVDDKFHAHKKARRAGAEALGLWVMCGSHAAGMDAGGLLEADEVETIALTMRLKEWKRAAAKLVEVGLWDAVGSDFQIHDFDQYRRGADREQARREKDAERKRAKRAEADQMSADIPRTCPQHDADTSADVSDASPRTSETSSEDASSRARAPAVPFRSAPSCLVPNQGEPGGATGGREIQTPPLDPHTATRIAWSEAVSAATGGLYPGVGSWPEEDAALAALRADAERAHVATLGAFDLGRFLGRLHDLVALWVTETRAKGGERFTGGWKPSKFVVWFSARQHEPEAAPVRESRFGPPTDEELGLAPRAQA